MAISWFAFNEYRVSVPIGDAQRYDLVVDDGLKLHRVEIKSSAYLSPTGSGYRIGLTTKGGNRSGTGKIVPLSTAEADLLFVVTPTRLLLVPISEVEGMSSMTTGGKYLKYEVSFPVNLVE